MYRELIGFKTSPHENVLVLKRFKGPLSARKMLVTVHAKLTEGTLTLHRIIANVKAPSRFSSPLCPCYDIGAVKADLEEPIPGHMSLAHQKARVQM